MISVVTPSFNQASYVERTLLSVAAQTGVEFEHIVVDGGSTDGSTAILNRHKDKLAKLIIEPDDGQADAIAKGMQHAKGDILCYLNSDDVLVAGALAWVDEYFRTHPDVDAIYSHRLFIGSDDQINRFWHLPPHSNYCMMRWDFIPQETCFWRKSLVQRVGTVDSSYQFAMDYEWFVRMMQAGTFRRVDTFLGAFRVHRKLNRAPNTRRLVSRKFSACVRITIFIYTGLIPPLSMRSAAISWAYRCYASFCC